MSKKLRAAELLAEALRRRAEVMVSLEPVAREQAADAVHQLRVSCNRIRAVLRVYREAFVEDPTRQLEDELHWLSGLLGSERDAEVMSDRLVRDLAQCPAEIASELAAATLIEEAAAERASAHRALMRAFDSDRYRVLLTLLGKFVDQPPFAPGTRGERWCWRQLEVAMERTRRRTTTLEACGAEREIGLHSVRKAAKRVRYGAELLSDEGSRRAKRVARRFHEVQQLLGDQHDATELCHRLEKTSERPGSGLLLGFVYCVEHQRAREFEREFFTRWKKTSRL